MKKIVTVALALVMALGLLAACTTQAPADKPTFTVGFDKEFPPMGFVADDGSYVGFDLDLAAKVAERMGYELKLQPIDWNSKNMELDSGNIDCVWNGFTINGREDEYTWTSPYLNNEQIVVVMADSAIASFADMTDAVVAVQDESSALGAIEGNADFKATLKEIVKTPTNLDALMELESGAVNAVVMDEFVARYNIEKKGANYKVLDEVVGDEQFGIGFKLGNTELRDKVEATLLELAQEGVLAEVSVEWFGEDIVTIGK